MPKCVALCKNGVPCDSQANARTQVCGILAHRYQSPVQEVREHALETYRRFDRPVPRPILRVTPEPQEFARPVQRAPAMREELLELIRAEERIAREAQQRALIDAAIRALHAPDAGGGWIIGRDPVGAPADLATIAADSQNIHRSSIQASALKSIDALKARRVPADQKTRLEILCALESAPSATLAEFLKDYEKTEALSTSYKILVAHVWAVIRSHKYHADLVRRLEEEITDGIAKCSNGKMVRLLNVLSGYDDAILVDESKGTKLQDKMAIIAQLPLTERAAAAAAVFDDAAVPAPERIVWLEALEGY
jgi:hypothetical protein